MNLPAHLRARGKSNMAPGDSINDARRPMQSNNMLICGEWIDIRAVSVMNRREHHYARAKRAREHRERAFNAFAFSGKTIPTLPVTVMLMRCAPQEQDDDNLRASLKAVRDGIADLYGIADNDPQIHWMYFQTKQSKWMVKVCIKRPGEERNHAPSPRVESMPCASLEGRASNV